MRPRTANTNVVKFISARNARPSIGVRMSKVFLAIIGILGLLFAFPAYSAIFTCTADKYIKDIQVVNRYVDYSYQEGNLLFDWHIDNLDKPSDVVDYLMITKYPSKYSILYPAKCQEKK